MHELRVPVLRSLVTVLIGAVAMAAEARGQHVAAPPEAMIAGAPADLDYWIVSTRCCPQSGSACCALRCPFDYCRVSGCGPIVCSDSVSFAQWLQPGVPVCIVAHGSLVSWESLVSDSGPLYRWIRNSAPDRPLQVVFFSWPSDTPIVCPSIDFIRLGRRARFNGFYLARLLAELPPESPVSFFGHSHGASVVASALHLAAGGAIEKQRLWFTPPNRPYRAVFAAAAIEQDWLGPDETYSLALWRADHLLNIYNSTDLPLCLYPWRYPFSDPALGRASFEREDLVELGPAVCKVAEMNVTRLLGCGHMWQHYYCWPQIASAMAPWIYFIGANPCFPHVAAPAPVAPPPLPASPPVLQP